MSSQSKLTTKERIYVDSRLSGMNQIASAAAAGSATPRTAGNAFENKARVQAEMLRRMQKTSDEVDFGRKEAHDMLMQAYATADTAMEQIAAVRELVKLHGLAEPLKVEHKHSHGGVVQLERMETRELMKLTGMDLTLEGEFEVVREPARITHKDE